MLALLEHLAPDIPLSSDDKLQLKLMNLADQSLQPLGSILTDSLPGYDTTLDWTADQRGLYLRYRPFFSESNGTRITRIGLDGSTTDVFAPVAIEIGHTRWSPDTAHLLTDIRFQEGVESNANWPEDVRPQNPLERILTLVGPPLAPLEASPIHSLLLEPSSGRKTWYTYASDSSTNIESIQFWHGNSQYLNNVWKKGDGPIGKTWKLYDLSGEQSLKSYTMPVPAKSVVEKAQGMAPYPSKRMALACYSLCCGTQALNTGVYIWDLENGQLTRVGPTIDQLEEAFPSVGMHERPEYDLSTVSPRQP